MSRVVKNVIVWVLALAVILCIIGGFTFGLSSLRSSGVALADSSAISYANGGVVRENILVYSTFTQLDSLNKISVVDDLFSSHVNYDDYNTLAVAANSYSVDDDGYLNVSSQTNSNSSTLKVLYVYRYSDPSAKNIGFSFTVNFKVKSIIPNSSPKISIVYYLPNQTSTFQPITISQTVSSDNFVVGENFIATVSGTIPSGYDLYGFQIDIPQNKNYSVFRGCISPYWLKAEIYSGDTYGFTGYVPYSKGTYDEGYNAGYDAGVTDGTETGYNTGYDEGYNAGVTDGTQSGYDDGYADGYDEGYNNGLADEVYTASEAFKSSGYSYTTVLTPGTSTRFEAVKQIGALVEGYENVNIPLSGLYFPASDLVAVGSTMGGLVAPADYEDLTDDDTLPLIQFFSQSKYALTFNNYVEMAQWLIDNPMDNLVLFPENIGSEGVDAIYFVMNDRSLLERFVSGAGAAYDLGYQGGYNAGYDVGDGDGYNRGYGVGFNDGQLDAVSGSYTFLGLIGSVIDAPISAFRGLLDFELLGVNMSSFVLAVMSLCVIIVIIRMVLR